MWVCEGNLPFLLLMTAALTLVSLTEEISDWDLGGTATMNTLSKYGFSIEIVTGLIYMTCMKKQWKVSGTFLFRNLFQMDWFLSGNYLPGVTVLLVPKWITWYAILNLRFLTLSGVNWMYIFTYVGVLQAWLAKNIPVTNLATYCNFFISNIGYFVSIICYNVKQEPELWLWSFSFPFSQ